MNTRGLFKGLLPFVKGRWTSRGQTSTAGRQGRRVWFSKTVFSGIFLFFFLLPQNTSAQCAMCRAVLESEENTAIAEGVNNGIVYLMAIPYILLAVLFYFVYKKMKS